MNERAKVLLLQHLAQHNPTARQTPHAHSLYIISVTPLYEDVSSQVHKVYGCTAVRHGAYLSPTGLAAAFCPAVLYQYCPGAAVSLS
jgi:hypothetical protein